MSELTEASNELTEAGGLRCANCGTPMVGEFCHHCGQSIHSVLKPVHHMLEDGMDMFLHVDGRILHTLPPLMRSPGFLTLEYFSGRRQRYVPPFRLMFVLCLLTFFAFHLAIDHVLSQVASRDAGGQWVLQEDRPFAHDATPDAVREDLERQLAGLHDARAAVTMAPGAVEAIHTSEAVLRQAASKRLVELGAAPLPGAKPAMAASTGTAVSAPRTPTETAPARNDADRDEWTVDPVHVRWLPDFANARLTGFLQHVKRNVRTALHGHSLEERQEARERMVAGVFSVLPQSMLVMIPLFALLLKLFYVFRRRLYMEHVIVALHSHAFLFASLLLLSLVGMLSAWLKPMAAWTGYPLGLVQTVLWLWMPAYLLIMQKRIYRQGWAMTLLKYWCVGWCYFWLLFVVLGFALVLGAGH